MPRVLFWNVNRKPLDSFILDLVDEHRPDLLALIEPDNLDGLGAELGFVGYARIPGGARFGLFAQPPFTLTREPGGDPDVPHAPAGSAGRPAGARAEFWRGVLSLGDDWLFVIVHAGDRRNVDEGTRRLSFKSTADTVRKVEEQTRHKRTVVFGDFNANPFDESVLSAQGLHAIGVRSFGGSFTRTVRGVGPVDYFYNPMWRLFGTGASDASAASHYFHGRQDCEVCWHMLDQVVIRPEFAHRLSEAGLRILRAAGKISLAGASGAPNSITASDHFPIVFTLT